MDEAEAADIVAARRARFEATNALADLVPLVDLLAEEEAWQDLANIPTYCLKENKALGTAERYVEACKNRATTLKLLISLMNTPNLLEQSARSR